MTFSSDFESMHFDSVDRANKQRRLEECPNWKSPNWKRGNKSLFLRCPGRANLRSFWLFVYFFSLKQRLRPLGHCAAKKSSSLWLDPIKRFQCKLLHLFPILMKSLNVKEPIILLKNGSSNIKSNSNRNGKKEDKDNLLEQLLKK